MVFRDASFRFCLASALVLAGCGEQDGTKTPLSQKRGTGGRTSNTGGTGGSLGDTGGTSSGARGGTMAGESGAGGEPADTGGTGGTTDTGGTAGSAGSTTDPGGAGGDDGAGGGDPGDPVALIGPWDKTVIEGMPYEFEATLARGALGYEWRRSSASSAFMTIPNATTNRFESPTSTLAENNSRFQVLVETAAGTLTSRVATLRVLPETSGAYAAVDSGSVHGEDPARVSFGMDTWGGIADLGAGTLAAGSFTPNGMNSVAAHLSVVFYNNTTQPITIPDGSISARVHGSYAGNPASTAGSSTISNGLLAVSTRAVAGFTHQVSTNYVNGVEVNVVHDFTENSGNANGRVDLASESKSGVDATLVLGAIVVPPAQTAWLTFDLTVSSYFGITDFTMPSTLHMRLPQGIDFDSNATIPLEWVERI